MVAIRGALSKGVGNCCSEREEILTTHPGDAGAMPRTASVLAAVEVLVDRASAPDGGVGRFAIWSFLGEVFWSLTKGC